MCGWCPGHDELCHKRCRDARGWAHAVDPFVAEIDGSSYVVRIPGERTEVLGINRLHEANAAQQAADLGIAPPIAGELSGFNTLITSFVEGQHLAGSLFTDRLPEVIDLIKRLRRTAVVSRSGYLMFHLPRNRPIF